MQASAILIIVALIALGGPPTVVARHVEKRLATHWRPPPLCRPRPVRPCPKLRFDNDWPDFPAQQAINGTCPLERGMQVLLDFHRRGLQNSSMVVNADYMKQIASLYLSLSSHLLCVDENDAGPRTGSSRSFAEVLKDAIQAVAKQNAKKIQEAANATKVVSF